MQVGRDLPITAAHRWAMQLLIAENVLFAAWQALVSGSFLTAFALMLGASGFVLGVLAAIPQLATIIPVLYDAGNLRINGLRRGVLLTSLWQGVLWAGGALVALLVPRFGLAVLLATYTLAAVSGAFSTIYFQPYVCAAVPEEIRGRFMGVRQALGTLGRAVAVVGAGWILDHLSETTGFLTIFSAAVLMAVVVGVLWYFIPDFSGATAKPDTRPITIRLRAFWESGQSLRTVVMVLALWTFVQSIAAPFFPLILVRELELSYQVIARFELFSYAVVILSSPLWGRLADRIGDSTAIAVTMAVMIASTSLYRFGNSTGDTLVVLAGHLLYGSAYAGYGFIGFNLIMRLIGVNGSATETAICWAVLGVAGFLGSIAAGWLTTNHLNTLLLASMCASVVVLFLWWNHAVTGVKQKGG